MGQNKLKSHGASPPKSGREELFSVIPDCDAILGCAIFRQTVFAIFFSDRRASIS